MPVIASNRVNTAALADARDRRRATPTSCRWPGRSWPTRCSSRKSRDRPRRAVNVCIACNQCIDQSIFDRRVSCVVNPRAGFELEPAGRRRSRARGASVAVVGGGPAGMEAARSLAAAGYAVDAVRGGRAARRAVPDGLPDPRQGGLRPDGRVLRARAGAARGVRRAGAAVRDAGALAGVRRGGGRDRRGAPAVDLPAPSCRTCVSYAELLLADDAAGGRARRDHRGGRDRRRRRAPVSARATAILRALRARPAGRPGSHGAPTAPVAEPRPTGHADAPRAADRRRLGPSTRWVVVQELRTAGVELLTGVEYERIEPDAVVIRDADGDERRIPADTVVIAAGQEPETALARGAGGAGMPHVVIGGAAGAELDAGRAFREGCGARGGRAAARLRFRTRRRRRIDPQVLARSAPARMSSAPRRFSGVVHARAGDRRGAEVAEPRASRGPRRDRAPLRRLFCAAVDLRAAIWHVLHPRAGATGLPAPSGLRAAGPVAGAAAGLLEQHDLADLGAALDRLDHVVDGQRRHRDGGERLHLDAGRPGVPASAVTCRRASASTDPSDARRQRQRMAERDQFDGSLGGLDPGDPRDPERVALGRIADNDRFPRSCAERARRPAPPRAAQSPACRRRRPSTPGPQRPDA